MKILYITPLWSGLNPFFFEGKEKNSGMPAFYNIFLSILNDEKFKSVVVFLFINGKTKEINIPKKYKNKLHVVPFFYDTKLSFIMSLLRLTFSYFKEFRNKKSFIFTHGSFGSIGSLLSFLHKRPVVRRLYGSFLINEIKSRKFYIFQKHPLEYLSFALPASSTIITNDGTYGDKVYEKIGHKKSRLFFLMNGVDKTAPIGNHTKFDISSPFISYIARFDTWKRQHILLESLNVLALAGQNIPCYFIGQNINDPYFKNLEKIIKDNGLDHIKLIPGLQHDEALWFLKNSHFTLSLYETSNLGNVFLESLAIGTPIITLKDGSLNSIPKNAYYAVETADKEEIAEAILKLWTTQSLRNQLAEKGIEFSKKHLLSWEERIKIEKDIILQLYQQNESLL